MGKIKYTDNSQMPFGIHQGKKLIDVPASYLKYIWENTYKCIADEQRPLSVYIEENLNALNQELIQKNRKS